MVAELSHERVYACAFCRGEGEKPAGTLCIVCKRKGTVRVFRPPTAVCAFCKGEGENQPETLLPCEACNGKGVISVMEPVEVCPNCHGNGREPTNRSVCATCRGAGVITEIEVDTGIPDLWGHERGCLEVILEEGQVGRATVARRVGISPDYVEYVCRTLAEKGLVKISMSDPIRRIGRGQMFYPTSLAKKALKLEMQGG